jgi:hypothetical protein
MSVTFNGYPTIRYLGYHNDQNQLVLGCTTSADTICNPLYKRLKRGDLEQFHLKKPLAGVRLLNSRSLSSTLEARQHLPYVQPSLPAILQISAMNTRRTNTTCTGCTADTGRRGIWLLFGRSTELKNDIFLTG